MAKRDTAVTATVTELRHLIATSYEVDDQLPNEKQLAETLDVSRGTVREALGALAVEGLVSRRWGSGTFVAPPRPAASLTMSTIQSYRDRVQLGGHIVEIRDSTCELAIAPDPVLAALGLPAGTQTWKVYRLFTVDGQPSAAMTEHIPTQLLGVSIDPSAMLTIETDLFVMLDSHIAGVVFHTVSDVSAIVVDSSEAESLGLEVGHPVLRSEQITLDRNDVPLAHSVSLQSTDVLRMRITR